MHCLKISDDALYLKTENVNEFLIILKEDNEALFLSWLLKKSMERKILL
jgi:hypothetical protein